MKILYGISILVALSCLMPLSAFAGTVDITPVIDYGFGILYAALLGTAAAAGAYIARHFKILANIHAETHATEVFERALVLAFKWAKQQVPDNMKSIEVKNRILELAIEYLLPKIPKALERLGISPNGVRTRIEARFDELLYKSQMTSFKQE